MMGTVGLVFMPGLDHRRGCISGFLGEKRKGGWGYCRYSYSEVSRVRTLGFRHIVGIGREEILGICCR